MAQKLSSSVEDIAVAAQRLRDGRLVAFATETVYGLGANALDDVAARRIYEVKGRPPTDPLIVHVPSLEEGLPLWDFEGIPNDGNAGRQQANQSVLASASEPASDTASGDVGRLVAALAARFWPGPLTIVARAAAHVPRCVTGGSGFVGVRVPAHPTAMALLRAAGVPVAAPSANTFGHVSPTAADHVLADLALRDPTLTVVDGGACAIGIESTVLKVVSSRHTEVLRKGGVSVADIAATLGPLGVTVSVRDTRSKHARQHDDAQPMDGPGQLLSHYSPSVPAFLVAPGDVDGTIAGGSWGFSLPITSSASAAEVPLWIDGEKAIVLDYGGIFAALRPQALAYRSLSADGRPEEAAFAVFEALRWCETIDGAEAVIFPLITAFASTALSASALEADELLSAVEDRLFRAASGSTVCVVARKKPA